ncbi:RHS repeat-associated core domain-containing protein [Pseudomonas sp. Xaverov 83]|uniref:RHS repeat-associated core domain-containing protein n=1 Tax=Pseudomonas sp. Xaverov 83 TaxID=2666087 RepID=UPI001C5B81D4|nr:RHS repeat-associated core domain-containing protein [Pseudomonas sp. Xaverov 83]
MTTQTEAYQLFDTLSPMIHGVAQQSGKFHTYIPIAQLKGNNGLGPTLDINLFYSPELQDLTFVNWSMRLSHYLLWSPTSLSRTTSIMYLSRGEAWSFSENEFKGTPNFTVNFPDGGSNTMKVIWKDGTVEVLERHISTLIVPDPLNNREDAIYYILKKVITPTGHALTLNWEDYKQLGPSGLVDWDIPRLTSVSDDSQVLLKIAYPDHNRSSTDANYTRRPVVDGTVTFTVYPDTAQSYSYDFQITTAGLVKSAKNGTVDVARYSYEPVNPIPGSIQISRINQISRDSGLNDTLSYSADKQKISQHTKTFNSQPYTDKTYTFTDGKTTVIDSATSEKTEFYFDNNQRQFKEVQTSGSNTKTVESDISNTDTSFTSTTRTTFTNKAGQSRTESSTITMDTLGNPLSRTENDVTTEWTYYQGAPRLEILVRKETYTDPNASAGDWIGDYVNPIGWGGLLFGNSGLTWGTQEIRTTIAHRTPTTTTTQTANLPVNVSCPGDSNYFKVFIESEKVYTTRNGQRLDLQWTFYGYGDVPVRGTEVRGPTVKPTIKLTIFNPVGDPAGRLNAWQNGSMTVEETRYNEDVNSIHHGRVSATTQRILDSSGKTVANSTISTRFDYTLTGNELTTATRVTPGNSPEITTEETRLTLFDRLLSSSDTLGNTTDYKYDALGRVTEQTSYADDTSKITTGFTYSDSNSSAHNTVTRTSTLGEQTRETLDQLGRKIQSERLHSDERRWLTMATMTYDIRNRESTITEHDYRPDGSIFLSRTRNLSYDDWGAISKIEWVGGVTQGFDYDPVTLQQSQWTNYGTRHVASTTTRRDDGGGVQRFETHLHANGQLTHSYSSTYDALGRLSQESSSNAPDRLYTYDAFGRLTRITAAGETTVNEYPPHTLSATASAARLESAGQSITLGTRTVDSMGRVVQSTIGGRTTSFTYQDASAWSKASVVRASESTQPIPVTLNADYDVTRNLATETITGGIERNSNSATSSVTYTRSLRGILLSETDAFGNTTTQSYDTQGRVIRASSANATTNLLYDENGRLSTETVTAIAVGRAVLTRYTYDDTDREIERTFESSGFKTLRLTQSYGRTNQIASMALYEDGTLLREETFGYDAQGRLASYTCQGPRKPVTPEGLVLDRQSFTYDLAGNLKQCDNTANGRMFPDVYQYSTTDPNQLISVTRWKPDSTSQIFTFTYDREGYLSGGASGTLKYSAGGRLGNLNLAKGSYDYSYNNIGQIVGCAGPDYYDFFYYQGDFQYARKGVINIQGQLHNKLSVLLNKSSACLLQQNTLGVSAGAATVSYSFEIRDIKGTVIASLNTLDNSSSLFSYTPFGYRPHDWQHHSWIGFNGQPIDRVNGNYHLGNGTRVYNPETQNFQSPDTLSPFGQGGANTRSYCHNDPVNYSDPSGRSEIFNQEVVITHPGGMWDRIGVGIVTAAVIGIIGVVAAPFTGGASIGWAIVATGLAITSAGFGIAAVAIQESDPALSGIFGWVSFGTGIASGVTAVTGAVAAARTAAQAAARVTPYISSRPATPIWERTVQQVLPRRGNLPPGVSQSGTVNASVLGTPVSSTYEIYSGGQNANILFIDAHGFAMESQYKLPPMPNTEFQFRSAVGVKAADVKSSWQTRITGTTPYRYAPGATDIPNYILDEFTITEHMSIGALTSNYKTQLETMAKLLNADIVRPTSTVLLGDLLDELATQGFTYDRIVGNFCRGTMPYNTPPLIQSFRRAFGWY